MTPIPWTQFRDEFLSLYDPPMRAANTRSNMTYALRLVEALGVQTTADLTAPLIGRLVASRPDGESGHTTFGILGRIRVATRYAWTAGYLKVCPFQLRPLRRWVRVGPPAVGKHHARDEIKRVLALMAHDIMTSEGWVQWRARRLYAVTATVAYLALRRNEALCAHVADLDLIGRIFWVRAHADGNRGKTASSLAPVPIPDALVPILTDWLEHREDRPAGWPLPADNPWLFPTCGRAGRSSPWTGGELGKRPLDRLQALAKRAGVDGMTWQSLRRSWATHAEYHGLGPAMIQRVLRHTTPRTGELWYRTADLPNLRAAVAGINF